MKLAKFFVSSRQEAAMRQIKVFSSPINRVESLGSFKNLSERFCASRAVDPYASIRFAHSSYNAR
jgi:hypothetical protein